MRPRHRKKSPCLNVSVSSALIERALCVLDATCRTLEAHGVEVGVQRADESCQEARSYAQRNGERVHFSLVEQARRVPHEPKRTAGTRTGSLMTSARTPEWDYVPAGRLEFQFWSVRRVSPRRRGESPNVSTARMIGRFVAAVIDELSLVSEYRAEQRRAQLEREERARQWAEAERLRVQEIQRREALFRDMKEWRLACDIRAFVSAMQQATPPDGVEREERERWIAWALGVADQLDPLVT